jgi:hypothetical protein
VQPEQADFVAFVQARQHRLLRAAYLICGDHHLAEDLLQGALVKLALRWSRVREGDPEAFLRTVVYRDAVSWWRRRRRERLTDAPPARVDERGLTGSSIKQWNGPAWRNGGLVVRAAGSLMAVVDVTSGAVVRVLDANGCVPIGWLDARTVLLRTSGGGVLAWSLDTGSVTSVAAPCDGVIAI